MTATKEIFAKKMAQKLINCGKRYNALRMVLVEIVEDATLGDSILRPTLTTKAEHVLAANPIVYIDCDSAKALDALTRDVNNAIGIPACSECGSTDHEDFGHWDFCSQNKVEP